MPILSKERPIKEITLPESGAKVKVYEKQTYGDFLAIQKSSMSKMKIQTQQRKRNTDRQELEADLTEFMFNTLERMVVSWDFTDENNNPLPVNRENLELLDTEDALYIMSQVKVSGEDSDYDPEDEENSNLDDSSR